MEPKQKSDSTKYVIGLIIIALVIVVSSLVGQKENRMQDATDTETNNGTGDAPASFITIPVPGEEDADEMVVAPATKEGAKEAVVTYTDESGFTPDHLTVKAGERVRFVNKSSGKMWVGADEHPTHMEYDGTSLREHCATTPRASFDQCGDGMEYSFTFAKTGSWNYHNHLRPAMAGVVVVAQ